MTPRDVDQLTDAEYAAFDRYMRREIKELERQAAAARRGRR
jgi:hypothetical protein